MSEKTERPVFLGIDTSNYTTSVAVVSETGELLENSRKLLQVKEGEKGLRQSDALFQHWKALPQLLEPILIKYRGKISGICAGSRPRPVEGSYMPVFTAGSSLGSTLAAALGVDYSEISHQEGHFLAAAYGNDVDFSKPVICAHLSGGTLELIYKDGQKYEKVGGTKDISFGQLIDRVGVDCGFPFPAGRFVDENALSICSKGLKNPLCRVFTDGSYLNLSGLETALKKAKSTLSDDMLCYYMMDRIAEGFVSVVERAKADHGVESVLVSGGVACSVFLRRYCEDCASGLSGQRISKPYCFGRADLCSDNAAGEALYAAGVRL